MFQNLKNVFQNLKRYSFILMIGVGIITFLAHAHYLWDICMRYNLSYRFCLEAFKLISDSDPALFKLRLLRFVFFVSAIFYGFQKKSLTTFIFISMVIGIITGYCDPKSAVELKLLSNIFLKLVKTVVAPLIISTLIVGIAGHADIKQVGRMGLKSIIYFEIVTTIALFIGLSAINISHAGVGIKLPANPSSSHAIAAPQKQTISDVILHIFPENLSKSIVEGQMLQIVVFTVLFAIGMTLIAEKHRAPLVTFFESIAETMFKFTNIIMYYAPIGVGAAMAYTVGHMGIGILSNLFLLLLTLYGALIVFVLCILLPIMLIFKVPIRRFFSAVKEPMSIAFATTSSESALPIAMENMEALGVPRKIVAFVMPTGYSFNLDGTTLYLSLASIFVAQAAGIHLSFSQQLIMGLTLMLTSKGVAGIPRASMVILLGTAVSFNLPTAPIFIILGIDELMDMARTTVNVLGNCLATVVIAKWEGEFVLSPELEEASA